jgi:hypothetical protein
MFVENIEDLPESMRGDFVESERDGKKGYQHKDTIALANAMKHAKAEREQLKEKLSAFEASQQSAIEKAKADALEEARTKGDVKAIEERYQQQMADLERRVREEERGVVLKEIGEKTSKEKAISIADQIGAALGVDEFAGQNISDLIRSRVTVDAATGKEVYYDAKGSALSVDKKGFMAELKKDPRFKLLIKSETSTTGGGRTQGSGGGGASSQKKYSEMTLAERVAYNASK